VTTEIARALAERVQGLQITTVHGSPQTAERLLAQIMQRVPQVSSSRQAQTAPATKARHG
jgi:predicted glycosyltransferase